MNEAAIDSCNSCEHNEASQDAGTECSSEWAGSESQWFLFILVL